MGFRFRLPYVHVPAKGTRWMRRSGFPLDGHQELLVRKAIIYQQTLNLGFLSIQVMTVMKRSLLPNGYGLSLRK